MEPIRHTSPMLFVNPHASQSAHVTQHQNVVEKDAIEREDSLKIAEGNIKLVTTADAEDIFKRPNNYAHAPDKIQKQLEAYNNVAYAEKRETLSQLMGVDLYA
ncbi:hypothetical protein [Agaribacter flavus]|uniref:Uncharacterized protein n=1 Tax=Agaribacter flavus TaxID=1902781 RepID=A0ABV7FMH5_9ALTE